jgi:hypothetical protein
MKGAMMYEQLADKYITSSIQLLADGFVADAAIHAQLSTTYALLALKEKNDE